jgi:hypothetical protein
MAVLFAKSEQKSSAGEACEGLQRLKETILTLVRGFNFIMCLEFVTS